MPEIFLNGSYLEGGGQIIRTALALSTLTQTPFLCQEIRKNRPQPGLKAQHLEAIKALKEICHAETNKIKIGSSFLKYVPNKIQAGDYHFKIGTAGSIALLLQAVLPPCLFAPDEITLTISGGTCGKWQAPVEYFAEVFLPYLKKFVEKIDFEILKRGYFPKGGGEAKLIIKPKFKLENYQNFNYFFQGIKNKVPLILLDKNKKLIEIKGISHASINLKKAKVAERQAKAAEELLKSHYSCPLEIQIIYEETFSPGSGIVLWAVFGWEDYFLGSDALGELGKPAEKVGKEAAEKLIKTICSGATVDHYLQDQILLPMALLPSSSIKIDQLTNHTKTNIYVIEKFLPVKFEIKGNLIYSLERQ